MTNVPHIMYEDKSFNFSDTTENDSLIDQFLRCPDRKIDSFRL